MNLRHLITLAAVVGSQTLFAQDKTPSAKFEPEIKAFEEAERGVRR